MIIPVVNERSYGSGCGPNHSVWVREREKEALETNANPSASEYINSARLLNLCPSIFSSKNRDSYIYS